MRKTSMYMISGYLFLSRCNSCEFFWEYYKQNYTLHLHQKKVLVLAGFLLL